MPVVQTVDAEAGGDMPGVRLHLPRGVERRSITLIGKRLTLSEIFDVIRKDYFPRWDREKQWIIQFDGLRSLSGLCEQESSTIWICAQAPERGVKLKAIIIHEMCHALRHCYGHGTSWQKVMLRKASIAEEKGEKRLSCLLYDQVRAYEGSPPMRAAEIYGMIEDAVLDQPAASYEAVVTWVAKYLGFFPPELEERYPLCKVTFDKAKRFLDGIRPRTKLSSL
jgi:hypothetical protein